MNLEDRIAAFEKLGKYLNAIDEAEFGEITSRARNENSWFTPESIRTAFAGIFSFLREGSLLNWLNSYHFNKEAKPKVIALVMAGNIPLVGFHDLLCVLISGNIAQIKLSSKDKVLMMFVIQKLEEFEPRFQGAIQIVDRLKNFDAVIATGSDNSARYFDYYFSKYPHIIRKNRSSCAVLSGFESNEELKSLGRDVFSYFGLGCRNVSKLFIPENYDFANLIESWKPFENVMIPHKYHNNYDYQKSILLVNREPFLDSGFCLFQENKKLVSPISVVYYEYYAAWEDALARIAEEHDKIQCIVGNIDHATVKIGQAQFPQLWDYADQIDTLKFLENLN